MKKTLVKLLLFFVLNYSYGQSLTAFGYIERSNYSIKKKGGKVKFSTAYIRLLKNYSRTAKKINKGSKKIYKTHVD